MNSCKELSVLARAGSSEYSTLYLSQISGEKPSHCTNMRSEMKFKTGKQAKASGFAVRTVYCPMQAKQSTICLLVVSSVRKIRVHLYPTASSAGGET